MLEIIPGEVPTQKLFGYLLGSVAPRPIAFASTMDKDGNPNLSPFSFFNVFGANPPTLVFSPSRRGRDNTTKDTFDNVKVFPEVVINTVSHSMVNQASLASNEFEKGVDEFAKAGFTPLASDLVKPFRVKESMIQMECKVKQIIETGQEGGAGNLVICEVLKMHINEAILDEQGMIDPQKAQLVGRMGKDYYAKAFGDSVFEVEKPGVEVGIGYDALPETVRNSKVLSGNDLGLLGNLKQMPTNAAIEQIKATENYLNIDKTKTQGSAAFEQAMHQWAKELIAEGKIQQALALLIS